MEKCYKIMIIAGEASGDLHGANLVKELKQLAPNLELSGVGGANMKQAGVKLLADIANYSVCGFVEIIAYLPKLYTLLRNVARKIKTERPDLLILIDYPTFNLRLAHIAGKLNIKVLYYISPQLWAWHTSRIKKIQKNVSMMAVIFPFETDFYQKHAVPVKYVGHPLVGKVKTVLSKEEIRRLLNIKENQLVIGLLPGSRQNEIKYILPALLQSAELLQQKRNDIKFILPLANTLALEKVESYVVSTKADVQIITDHHYDAMAACDAVVAASGTVTLELSLLGIPMVIVYKANQLSFAIAKRVVKIPYAGLCNILVNKKIVEELLQDKANPKNICTEILRLVEDSHYRKAQIDQLAKVTEKLSLQKECSVGQVAYNVLCNS